MAIIDYYPRLSLSLFKRMIKDVEAFKKKTAHISEERRQQLFTQLYAAHFTTGFTIDGVKISVEAEVDKSEWEAHALLFKWTDEEGTARRQRIFLQGREDNLGKSFVWYFLSPKYGYLCRKLYFDGYCFFGRRDIRHTYSIQHQSHGNRIAQRVAKDPYRANGKTHYRGKPTPYGRRLQRYQKAGEAATKAILYLMAKTMGRV